LECSIFSSEQQLGTDKRYRKINDLASGGFKPTTFTFPRITTIFTHDMFMSGVVAALDGKVKVVDLQGSFSTSQLLLSALPGISNPM